MASNPRITTYFRNTAKSMGYALTDYALDQAPTIAATLSAAKAGTRSIRDSIRELSINNASANTRQFANKSADGEEEGYGRILDNLKNGNWYIKASSSFEYDTNKLDDIDVKTEDWGDETDTSSSVAQSAKSVMSQNETNSRAIISSVSKVSSNVSKTIAYSSVESARYIAKSNRRGQRALYDLNKAGFNQVTNALLLLNTSVESIAKLNTPLLTHVQNSAVFYTKTTESLNKINNTLTEMNKSLKNIESAQPHVSGQDKRKKARRVYTAGNMSPSDYFDMVAGNIRDKSKAAQELMKMIGFGNKDDKSQRQMSLQNQMVMAALSFLIPSYTKNAFKSLDRNFKNIFSQGMMDLSKRSQASTNPLARMLGAFLLPNVKTSTKMNPADYEKGQVAWDGMARQSLIRVIPTALFKIYSAITGTPEMTYDFNSGKYIKVSSAKALVNKTRSNIAKGAGGDFRKTALNKVKTSKLTGKKRQEMIDQIESYFFHAFEKGYGFDVGSNQNNAAWLKEFGITPQAAALLLEALNEEESKSRISARAKFGADISSALTKYSTKLDQESKNGTSLSLLEAEGSDFGGGITDKYNNNQLFYLQGIYQYTALLAANINYLAGKSNKFRHVKGFSKNGKIENVYTPQVADAAKFQAANDHKNSNKNSGYDPLNDENYGKTSNEIMDDAAVKSIKEFGKNFNKTKKEIDDAKKSKLKNAIKDTTGEEDPNRNSKVKDTLKRLYNAPFEGITRMINMLSYSMTSMLWGYDGKAGLIDTLLDKGKNLFDKVKQRMMDYFGGVIGADELKEDAKNGLKKAGKHVWKSTKGLASYLLTGPDHDNRDEVDPDDIAKESASGSGLWLSGGASKNRKKKRNTKNKTAKFQEAKPGQKYRTRGSNNKQEEEVNNSIKSGLSNIISGIGNFFSIANPVSSGNKRKGPDPIENRNFLGIVAKALGDSGDTRGATIVGGLAGAGVSILTGAVVGPLAGAAIGGAASLISSSEAVRNAIFGKPDKDGNYESAIANFLNKDLKSTATGMTIGAVGGTLLGSPLLGAIVGSGVAYVHSSDAAKDFLFGKVGEDGKRTGSELFKKEFQDKVKKAIPNMSAGALAGAMVGPFGLAGNLIVGAGIGYLASGDKFQKWMFGEDGKGGFVVTLRDKFLTHIDTLGRNMLYAVKGSIKDIGNRVGKSLLVHSKSIGGWLAKKIFTKDPSTLMGRFFGRAERVTKAIGTSTFGRMSNFVTKAASRRTAKNLRKGYETYGNVIDENGHFVYDENGKQVKRKLNAAERQRLRESMNRGGALKNKYLDNESARMDTILANANSIEDLNSLRDIIGRANSIDSDKATNAKLEFKNKYGFDLTKSQLANAKALINQEAASRFTPEALEKKEKEDAAKRNKAMTEDVAAIRQKITGERSQNAATKSKAAAAVEQGGEELKETLNASSGISSIGSDGKQYITTFDALGNPHTRSVEPGGKLGEERKDDNNTRLSKKMMDKFYGAITSIPLIGGAINKLGGLFGTVKDKLFGNKETGDKGVFGKLFDSLLGKDGLLGQFLSFLSGTPLGGVLSKFSLKGVINSAWPILLGSAAYAGTYGLLSGKFDNVLHNMTKGKFGDDDKKYVKQITNEDGTTTTLQEDEKGNLTNPETGEKISNSDPRVTTTRGDVDSASDRAKYNVARSIVTGKGTKNVATLGAKIGNKYFMKNKYVAKGARAAKELAPKVLPLIDAAITKLIGGLKKVPLLKGAPLDEMFAALKDKIVANIGKAGSKLASISNTIGKAIPFINAAFILNDFITGYQDARTTMGITAEPTFGQRILSGIIRTTKNLIPYIGTFIPDSLLVDIFCKFVGPFTGEDPNSLKSKRAEADAEVEQYNKENGTNLTKEQYIKQVLHDYTWTEKVGNSIHNFFSGNKDKEQNTAASTVQSANMSPSYMNPNATAINNVTPTGGASGIEIKTPSTNNFNLNVQPSYMNGLKDYSKKISDSISTIQNFATKGDIGGLMNYGVNTAKEAGSNFLESIGAKPYINSMKLSLLPQATTKAIESVLFKQSEVKKTENENITTISSFINALKSMSTASKEGNIDQIKSIDLNINKNNIFGYIFSNAMRMVKSYYYITGMINKVKKDGLLGTLKNLVFGNSGGGSSTASNTNNKTNISAGGSFVSQYDAKYQNHRINGQSFADKGCGPSVAAMMADDAGARMSVNDAVKASRGYQNNGGVSADYFGKALGSRGIKIKYLTGGSTYINPGVPAQVARSLQSGHEVAILGQDVGNRSKANSPFGPGNHYVLAKGMDRNGNILVNDPEQSGPTVYGPGILNSAKLGMAMSGGDSETDGNMFTESAATIALGHQPRSNVDHQRVENYMKYGSLDGPKKTKAAATIALGHQPHSNLDFQKVDNYMKYGTLEGVANGEKVAYASPSIENYRNENLGSWSTPTEAELNEYIKKANSGSPFNGNAKVFLQAATESGLDPRYILAHAALESGWGTSRIAKDKNNYFGIGAFDNSPYASAHSFGSGLEKGIIGGALWIADNYYRGKYGQRSLYTMRHDPTGHGHNYATDPEWDIRIAKIMNNMPANTKLTLNDGAMSSSAGQYDTSTINSTGSTSSTGSTGSILSKIIGAFTKGFSKFFGGNDEDEESSATESTQGNSESNDQVATSANISTNRNSADVLNGFPYFNQAEEPWNSHPYPGGSTAKTVGKGGCGPTSMAMVVKSYGNNNVTPAVAADYAVKNGYRVPSGTAWSFFKNFGAQYGLQVNQYSPDNNKTREYLKKGIPVIGSMDSKLGTTFTKGKHFIVFTGYDPNTDKVVVNDPSHRDLSATQEFQSDFAMNQGKQFWAIYKNENSGSLGKLKNNKNKVDDTETVVPGNSSGGSSNIYNISDYRNLASGGSSGVLIKSRPGSNGMIINPSNGFKLNKSTLSYAKQFAGGAAMVQDTTKMLNNLKTQVGNTQGVSNDVLARLIEVIINILGSIANNTAPVEQIYQQLVAYNTNKSGGASEMDTKPRNTPNNIVKTTKTTKPSTKNTLKQPQPQDDDPQIVSMVNMLASIAKG